jgi:hypothetical protein
MEEKPKKFKKFNPYRSNEFENFAFFLALPKDERKKVFGFYTETDFCKHFKINRTTPVEWKKQDKLWRLRDKYLINFKQYTPEVLNGLRKKAKEGRAPEVMAWFKIVENWREKNVIDVETKTNEIENISKEELAIRIVEILEEAGLEIEEEGNKILLKKKDY